MRSEPALRLGVRDRLGGLGSNRVDLGWRVIPGGRGRRRDNMDIEDLEDWDRPDGFPFLEFKDDGREPEQVIAEDEPDREGGGE